MVIWYTLSDTDYLIHILWYKFFDTYDLRGEIQVDSLLQEVVTLRNHHFGKQSKGGKDEGCAGEDQKETKKILLT